MTDRAESQSANIVPPRLYQAASTTGQVTTTHPSGVWVQAVDGTARPYNISLLPFGGKQAPAAAQQDHVYITMLCETADVYFYFSNTTGGATLDDTAVNAAGVAIVEATAMLSTMPSRLPKDMPLNFRLDRNVDKWLMLKCAGSGTATLRVWASSQSEV